MLWQTNQGPSTTNLPTHHHHHHLQSSHRTLATSKVLSAVLLCSVSCCSTLSDRRESDDKCCKPRNVTEAGMSEFERRFSKRIAAKKTDKNPPPLPCAEAAINMPQRKSSGKKGTRKKLEGDVAEGRKGKVRCFASVSMTDLSSPPSFEGEYLRRSRYTERYSWSKSVLSLSNGFH